MRRRLLTPSFHFNILKDFLIPMNEHTDILIEVLKERLLSDEKKGLDIFPLINRTSLDIISSKYVYVYHKLLSAG